MRRVIQGSIENEGKEKEVNKKVYKTQSSKITQMIIHFTGQKSLFLRH